MKVTPLDIVDAAYDFEATQDEWLAALCAQLPSLYGSTGGAFAYEFSIDGDALSLGRVVQHETSERVPVLIKTMVDNATPIVLHHFYRYTPTCGTFADAIDICGVPELEPVGRRMFREAGGFEDIFAVIAHGKNGRHLHMNLPQPEWQGPSSTAMRERWSRISAHVAAGYRLREELLSWEEGDAILDPGGELVHARTDDPKTARDALREAVRERERARGKMRRDAPDDALEIWRGLVDGRWSLVDHIDHDGRRFVVARANEPSVSDPRALTPRERQVAHWVARGASTKVTAYALGLSIGSIGTHLHSIQTKLQAKNRAHLVRLLRAIPEEVLEPGS